MQFIANGPDIPDALLQAHEEGRVVFFCGAGVSYPAGLPGFGGLVDEIYRRNGTAPSNIEDAALKRGQFDAALDLLERRLPGQRLSVRGALAEALTPRLRRKGALDTHTALLRLARSRDGALRLVTTNFDRLFHAAAKRSKQVLQVHTAPMLPIPKKSRWNGLVCLHGVLPEKADDTALNRLVVTSGDFGLAYLTERWAARFVSELFRNYVVCFVGYSINDPVLRYMMDALAADRMLGEVSPQAWALGDSEVGQESQKTIEWGAKGVTPILYSVAAGTRDHSALHHTMHAWAETYRDGVTGKERIVVAHALARPTASTRQDDFVGRMLWALSDPTGLPAQRFAEFNPAPSLDWLLDALASDRFGHADLVRFGVPPRDETDAKLRFSMIHRPAPYPLAPPMRLVVGGTSHSQLDSVMFQLGRWLLRHLDDPQLVLWIAERGGRLHEQWSRQIEHRLDQLDQLEHDGRTADLDGIRAHAPNAIPGRLMRTLWRLLISGRVKSSRSEPALQRLRGRLARERMTTTLRLELREALLPRVRLSRPLQWSEDPETTDERTRARRLLDVELVLASDHVRAALHHIADLQWQGALPMFLDDVQLLLRDALDLLRELAEPDEQSDLSHWYLPSISPHWQNRGLRDWVSLIELLRDVWLAVRGVDANRASRIVASWFDMPYSTFKRLALFGASHDECVAPEQWVEWVCADRARWLWAIETQREVLRLLVLQGQCLTAATQGRLESAILAGPPREMYRADLDDDWWQRFLAHSVWLHLAKLKSSGLKLGAPSSSRLEELSRSNPNWQLAPNERDEFSNWMSGSGDPDHEHVRDVNIAPRTRRELVQWLVEPQPDRRPFYEDTWRDVCRTRFRQSLHALCDLAQRNLWPASRWRDALQVWSEDGMVSRSWRFAAPIVATMPSQVVQELAHAVTFWLQAASKSIDRHEAILLDMCQRVLSLAQDGGLANQVGDGEAIQKPVSAAINHPIGHVAQALIGLWFKRRPKDGDGIPTDIRPLFTQLCDVRTEPYRHGRVLLASRLIAIFRADPLWATECLLPRFNWTVDSMEAKAVWEGFLWSPRLYQPLLLALKPHFLDTARRYDNLGEHSGQLAAFLTYAAMEPIGGYTTEEWRDSLAALPQEGLEESAQAMVQALEGAADQRHEYWKNRVQPFWQNVWPKSRHLATPRIAESLARLCIAAGLEFPAALDAIKNWLQPIEYPDYVVDLLWESEVCSRFPKRALELLAAVLTNQPWGASKLERCLERILEADPNLADSDDVRRLRVYARQTS